MGDGVFRLLRGYWIKLTFSLIVAFLCCYINYQAGCQIGANRAKDYIMSEYGIPSNLVTKTTGERLIRIYGPVFFPKDGVEVYRTIDHFGDEIPNGFELEIAIFDPEKKVLTEIYERIEFFKPSKQMDENSSYGPIHSNTGDDS